MLSPTNDPPALPPVEESNQENGHGSNIGRPPPRRAISYSGMINNYFDWMPSEPNSPKDRHDIISRLKFKDRIRHFTWSWFAMTMATGGIANVLYSIPSPVRFPHLYALGCIYFILNIVLFIFNICMISLRFYWFPSTFRASFLHPTESLFIPAAAISFGTIMINITQYGVGDETGQWLVSAMTIIFWIYATMAVVLSAGIYLIMWSTTTFTIAQMTPIWIFPAYPLLITGPFAANLAKKIAAEKALQIIVGGYILQGIGFLVSLMIYSAFLYRLMTQKLPKENVRPGMFISVGPSGFTIAGVIGMGQVLPHVVGPDFMGEGMGEFAGRVSMVAANWMGIWLWGLAIWFFIVSVCAHFTSAYKGKVHFAMTWYSFVFPNTALTTATFAVHTALNNNHAIEIFGCVLATGVVLTWFFVFISMIRAVYTKQILWPQRQEDRDEGGWEEGDENRASLDRREITKKRVGTMVLNSKKILDEELGGVRNGIKRVTVQRDRERDSQLLTPGIPLRVKEELELELG